MNRGFAVVLLALLGLARMPGQEPSGEGGVLVLDLPTALRMAAARNLTLQDGALAASSARERLRAEQGGFDPELALSWNRSVDANAQPLDPFGNQPPSSEIQSDQYEATVRGALPWGASYRAGFSSQNRRGTFNQFADNYYSFLGVSVTQPLLRNSGSRAALAGVRMARTDAAAAGYAHQQLINDTLTATTFAFYRLALARGSLTVSERSVGLVEQLVRDNEKRHERGAMSTQDVLEARARAARRREALFVGRLAVSTAENSLKRHLFSDIGESNGRRIEPRLVQEESPGDELLLQWAAAGLEARPDVQQARLGVERRRVELGLARSRQLPELNIVATYGYNGSAASFGDSVDRVKEADSDSYSVGAVFSVPLPNRTASARKRAAVIELRRAELLLTDFEHEVRRQLADAMAGIAAARERVATTVEARGLAEQSLEAEEKRLRAGTSSTFLVLEQQEIVAEAQLRELQASADLALALADFHRLSGRTVEAFGLEAATTSIAAPK